MTGDAGGAPQTAAQILRAAGALGLARLDAQLLLLHVLRRPLHDRAWLVAHDDDVLPAQTWPRFLQLATRRVAGEPAAYLVGEKEFHGLTLQVDARVLVPRPETELLVDWALQVLQGQAAPCVLDLGTGSGAVALAIASRHAGARVSAVDASPEALAVAAANAARLGIEIALRQADWLAGSPGGLDLIVANPPYVALGDPHLDALHHEPRGALVAGEDGLLDIRRIVEDSPRHLAEGGWLLLEHGHDQAAAVRALLADRGFSKPQSRADLAGIDRCTGAIWRPVK